jgi:hypothetical protein
LHAVKVSTKTLESIDKEDHVCCSVSGTVSVTLSKGETGCPKRSPQPYYLGTCTWALYLD